MDPCARSTGGVAELVGSMPSSMASFTITSATREFSTEPFSSSPSSSSPPSPRPPLLPARTQLIAPVPPPFRVENGPIGSPAKVNSPDPAVRSAGATPAPVGSSTKGAVRYRECLKNHAASVGGHVVDGCGEFMPEEEADGLNLKCSVCGCHRSFHRKEIEGISFSSNVPPAYYYQQYHNGSGGHRRNGIPPPALLALPPPQPRANPHPYNPTPVTAFAGRGGCYDGGGGVGGATTESSSEEHDVHTPVAAAAAAAGGGEYGHGHGQGHVFCPVAPPSVLSRKRFRTKFTAEQKEKMLGFAEGMGWRMHRNNEVAVERFCSEIGVSRQVFKVWMHNNKHVVSPTAAPPKRLEQPQQQQQLNHDEERKM